MEELGIDLNVDDLSSLCKVSVTRTKGTFIIDYFSFFLDSNLSRLTLRPHVPDGKVEGEGLGWFSAEEIHHLLVRPEDRIAVDTFFREHGT